MYDRMTQVSKETGVSIAELVRRAMASYLDPVPVIVETAPDETTLQVPYAGTAPAGPIAEVIAQNTALRLSDEVAREMGASESDIFVRARGDSMEGAGIFDEQLVLFELLAPGADPRRDRIALVQMVRDDGTYHSTIKRWAGRDDKGRPVLKDGQGKAVKVPGNVVDVFAVGTAVSVMGRL